MFGAVLSALVSCFLAVSVTGSLEFVHNSSQNEDSHQHHQKHHDHGLTSGSQHPSDPIRIIGDGGTIVNNDIVLLLVQSMNTSTSMPPTLGTMLAPVAVAATAATATTSTVSTSMTGGKSHQPELRRLHRRRRRRQTDNTDPMTDGPDSPASNSSFSSDEVRWSNINEQVDMVIPMVLAHLHKVGLTHLDLPDMQESLSVRPLFITYSAGLWLNNGLVYNLEGIKRSGDALMTYSDKSFICRFYLLIRSLQFDYDFLIKLMSIEGYGKVVGSLDDTVIYADLSINVEDTRLRLNDFRIVKFRNIQVQLSERRFIQELSGVILSPITNLFRDRITTSISDGLKDQMQGVMDDFNDNDPLELRSFTKQMLAGLLSQM